MSSLAFRCAARAQRTSAVICPLSSQPPTLFSNTALSLGLAMDGTE
jgi:hypothetical protein